MYLPVYSREMRKAILFVILMHSVLLSGLFARPVPNDIIGKWQNPTGEKIMEIYKQNELYYGKIIECSDHEVPLGTIILKGFKFKSAGNKWEGIIYVPKQGKDFPGTLTLKDEKTLAIEASFGFMSRVKEWKRVGKK